MSARDDEFYTRPGGRLVRVDPWPTMRSEDEKIARRRGHKEPVSFVILVRRDGRIVRSIAG